MGQPHEKACKLINWIFLGPPYKGQKIEGFLFASGPLPNKWFVNGPFNVKFDQLKFWK